MRIILSLLLAATLSLFAQDAPKGKGKGGPPKNLQILTPETYRAAMQSFTQALGVQCAFCHVDDRSSDEKEEKKMARMMLTMTREINAKFPDGKQHVACFTCHRGAEMPLMAPPAADADKK
jgi:photosynthetic reaction center cytochrome c subunit